MAEHPLASRWVDDLGIQRSVELLPKQSPAQMADLFRKSQVTVSPSTHDGTPNTLLEAMACGCFPIAGDIQSLREWITPGVNGLLVDPRKPQALAEAIVQAIKYEALRVSAAEYNTRLIINKAEYNHVMQAALDFYQSLC
jgi:glycosyltransferase involved in cell wall biosynthesis